MARGSLSPQMIARILDHARANDFKAGQHLPAQLLADTFRVSRAPIVAALKKLADQGVVQAEPNRGFFLVSDANDLPAPDDDGAGEDAVYFQIAEDRLAGRLAAPFGGVQAAGAVQAPSSQLEHDPRQAHPPQPSSSGRSELAAAGHDPPMALELINVMFSRLWAGRCGKPDHWPHLQRMPARSAGGIQEGELRALPGHEGAHRRRDGPLSLLAASGDQRERRRDWRSRVAASPTNPTGAAAPLAVGHDDEQSRRGSGAGLRGRGTFRIRGATGADTGAHRR